jgi:hypothetical protein
VLSLLVLACASNPPDPPGRPTALAPDVASGLKSLGSGAVSLAIDPGQTKDLDPIGLATSIGVTPPACADFALSFSWQITTPPGAENLNVAFKGERQGGIFEVAPPAPHGAATIGCALLEVSDVNSVPVVVQLRFTVATSRR